jgi:hypothetical protein
MSCKIVSWCTPHLLHNVEQTHDHEGGKIRVLRYHGDDSLGCTEGNEVFPANHDNHGSTWAVRDNFGRERRCCNNNAGEAELENRPTCGRLVSEI